jgi:hypothetical protein
VAPAPYKTDNRKIDVATLSASGKRPSARIVNRCALYNLDDLQKPMQSVAEPTGLKPPTSACAWFHEVRGKNYPRANEVAFAGRI